MLNFPKTDRDFEHALRFLSDKMPDAKALPKPTLLHSVRVGVYLYNHGYESTICIAGLLHDLVEDADVTVKDIAKEFGRDVADIVKANTKNEELPEDIRYEELMKACIQSGEKASIVKAADIIDNLTTCRRIQSEIWIKNMTRFGKILLKLKPQEYNDRIFVELEDLLTNS